MMNLKKVQLGVLGLALLCIQSMYAISSDKVPEGRKPLISEKPPTPPSKGKSKSGNGTLGIPTNRTITSTKNSDGSTTYTIAGSNQDGISYTREVNVSQNRRGSYTIKGEGLTMYAPDGTTEIYTAEFQNIKGQPSYVIQGRQGRGVTITVTATNATGDMTSDDLTAIFDGLS